MTRTNLILALLICLCATSAFGKNTDDTDTIWRHSIGSSLFLLGNIDTGKPVYYGQLNYGYRLSPKDNILVEAATWTYYEPLGTYGDSEEFYPGKVLAVGVGLGYQRFLWKKAFAAAVATPFLQRFYDADDNKIQDGFQLYIQATVGYRLEFFKKRWFFDPALGVTFWPVNTNFPDSFAEIENGKPKYKCEPRANFGYRF